MTEHRMTREELKAIGNACWKEAMTRSQGGTKQVTMFDLMCSVPGVLELATDNAVVYGQLALALNIRANVVHSLTGLKSTQKKHA